MLLLDFSDNVKSLGAFHSKYTKEILKNTKENKETGYFHFCYLYGISKMVGCITEVIALLLTPILTYIHIVDVRTTYKSYM